VGAAAVGAKSGAERSCCRRSGDALRRNQREGTGETATCACVRGRVLPLPLRAALQFEQLQFHWGKPPPAAEPRTFTRIPTLPPMTAWGGPKNYSSALAYELTSQLRSISSCFGVTHSMVCVPPRVELANTKTEYHELNLKGIGRLKHTPRCQITGIRLKRILDSSPEQLIPPRLAHRIQSENTRSDTVSDT
jgi:hypothetical protein